MDDLDHVQKTSNHARVIAGLVAAIPTIQARCPDHRDGRDKPGHDDSM
jgi:hypothetical protein